MKHGVDDVYMCRWSHGHHIPTSSVAGTRSTATPASAALWCVLAIKLLDDSTPITRNPRLANSMAPRPVPMPMSTATGRAWLDVGGVALWILDHMDSG